MVLKRSSKKTLITKHRKHAKDTGSSQVQLAILNERIVELTKHLKKNKKDESSRRGLLKIVAERRAHQKYLAAKKK